MTSKYIAGTRDGDPGWIRVRDLLDMLAECRPDAMICTDSGPVTRVKHEPGANEPFVYFGSAAGPRSCPSCGSVAVECAQCAAHFTIGVETSFAGQHLNVERPEPPIRYDLLSEYADKHRLHYNDLCRVVREAVFGVPETTQCPACNGYGRVNDGSGARSPYGPKCPKCGGSGSVPATGVPPPDEVIARGQVTVSVAGSWRDTRGVNAPVKEQPK